jgi:uncharacterized damage-inducible protein DinB
MTTSRVRVDALVELFDHSLDEDPAEFDGNLWHSMMGNLNACRPEDWDALPPGAVRSIRDLVHHVGGCYLMYENHGFGDRSKTWEDSIVDGIAPGESIEENLAWFRAAHRTFRESLASITDDQLDELTYGHWGGQLPRRRVVELMIQHGIYHAGEINHLRCLLQGNDE